MTAMPTVKVLLLLDTLEVGGAERSLLEISRRFQRTRPVMCHVYAGSALRAAYEEAGVPVISLNIRGRYDFHRALREVLRVVREERPDVLHATLARVSLIARAASRLSGVPLVDSLVSDRYGEQRLREAPTLLRTKLRVFALADRLTAGWVAEFAAVSHAVRASSARALAVPPEVIRVIHRGRDTDMGLPRDSSAVADLRQSLGLADSARVVLNVGRLRAGKGQEELIAAFAEVRRAVPEATLLIAGEGPLRPVLQAVVDRLGLGDSVRLLGTRDDVPALLASADVFVSASHHEGHSGAVLEAMFAGAPIVATDIAATRETVGDGDAASLVPLGDTGALAAGIRWVLDHPSESAQRASRARRLAHECFSVARVAAQHEQLYRDVVDRARRQRIRRVV